METFKKMEKITNGTHFSPIRHFSDSRYIFSYTVTQSAFLLKINLCKILHVITKVVFFNKKAD